MVLPEHLRDGTDANSDTDANTHRIAYPDADSFTDALAHAYPNPGSFAHAHTGPHPNANTYTNSDYLHFQFMGQ